MDSATESQRKISDAFASVLRSGRAGFNAQFAEARRLYPDLDGSAFSDFLLTSVNRLVVAVEQLRPDRVPEVAMAAYEAGLELVGQMLVGAGARGRMIEEGWRRVLPANAALVAVAPARVIDGFSNALHHLAATPGARSEQWIADLERLGPNCADVDSLLRLGQVAAWRAGLAHLRQGAIAAADLLPANLALAAVGATAASDWSVMRQRLLADPWFDPTASPAAAKTRSGLVQVMANAGAFRGFGGVFVEPPRVASSGEHFLVRSGEESWLLTADRFGATFHRAQVAEFVSASRQNQLPRGLRAAGSSVEWGKERLDLASLGQFTSAAANAKTLALTSELTHSVILVAFG